MSEKKYLSASRINTLDKCSWSYWCNYHLKLPQATNSGALRGTLCHLVFELLLNKKHRKHYNAIVKADSIKGSEALNRLVVKHLRRDGLWEDEIEDHYDLCDKMILTGLNHDFFCEGGKLLDPEFKFIIENENPEYKVLGFIDKAATFTKEKQIKIVDYKSSKQKYSGEDLTSNLQGMIYSMVAKKLWPKLKPVVQFKFIRFPRKPDQNLEFEEDQLKGLEHYLSHVYKIINNFTEKEATANYAADQPFPDKGAGFKGPLNCGFAKEKGQLKKDGSIMWHCPYKFDFEYYALLNSDGGVVKTSFDKKDLKKDDKHTIKKMHYEGCPRHNAQDDFDF